MQTTVGSAERVALALRSLYNQYGYSQYKMSKFEEYDLYARNKDFLISDSVITFTDTDGKLMALKPDVTLSIVKNSQDSCGVQKLFYNENVYRVTKGAHGFREIMQVGLEILGDVDDYSITEVLLLAGLSLNSISRDVVLDVSHLGLLSEVLESIGIPEEKKGQLMKFISEKNFHELTALCRNCGIGDGQIQLLRSLLSIGGTPAQALPQLETLLTGMVSQHTLDQFRTILQALEGSGIQQLLRIDLSVVDDIHYYNGFVFKGFVSGIPGSVLSGGQYDRLMSKMKRTDRAIGFAVYMDLLERLEQPAEEYDVDAVLLYDADASLSDIRRNAQLLTAQGRSVLVRRTKPDGLRYKKLLKIQGSEVLVLENNA
jgi:ATP phosphoribosyltransferase regulatory subunit